MTHVKVSVIRKPDYPAGQPAPCYLNCPCGAKPPMPSDVIECSCGVSYNAQGYVITPASKLTRIKVLIGYRAHAQFLYEISDEITGDLRVLGAIPRPDVPQPYSYGPTQYVYNAQGVPVIIVETRQRRYEVFRVDGTISPVEEG